MLNRIISHPAARAAGIASERFIGVLKPIIGVASVTIMPLYPSFPRSNPCRITLDSVAGRISSSFSSGLKYLLYAGCRICPAMMDKVPASTTSFQIAPYVLSYSSTERLFTEATRC